MPLPGKVCGLRTMAWLSSEQCMETGHNRHSGSKASPCIFFPQVPSMGTGSRLALPLLLIDCFDLSFQRFSPTPTPNRWEEAERMLCTGSPKPRGKAITLNDCQETKSHFLKGWHGRAFGSTRKLLIDLGASRTLNQAIEVSSMLGHQACKRRHGREERKKRVLLFCWTRACESRFQEGSKGQN